MFGISAWTAAHHLKLSLSKTELLFIPGKDCLCMDLSVTVEDVTVSPSSTARNLGVILDDRLYCATDITAVAQSYRFALFNINRFKLVMSCLDYCNSLLAGLPVYATKPLKRIQNTRLIYNLPKFSHVTYRLHDLHWLSVVACIWFKMMLLAFKAINRTAPTYLKTLVIPHAPARTHRSSTSAGRLVPHCWEQTKTTLWSHNSSLFWWLSCGTNSRPMSGQQNHSQSYERKTKDSFVQTSPHVFIIWLPPNKINK